MASVPATAVAPSPHPAPAPPTALADRGAEHTAYDVARYGSVIDWNPRCLLIHAQPRVIVSAEFHYFRVPDVSRWRPILAALLAAGFNAIRLYFHWGYHSPAEDVLDLTTGNRNLEYLLSLCEELHLFVIAAPGPYICAEVQAGGYPIWLVAKREIRIRHLTNAPLGGIKRWDEEFHSHCENYLRKIMRVLVPHERTTNPNGCIIALQLENELRQLTAGLIGGLDDELRRLAEVCRAAGSTVPFFHNDDNPVGSWAAGEANRSPKKFFKRTGPPSYRSDLYGFDLYMTFPPGDRSGDLSSAQVGLIEAGGVSACLNSCGIGGTGIGGSDTKGLECLYDKETTVSAPPLLGWSTTNQLPGKVDDLAYRFSTIGGSARLAPPFVAETQVGWINQWGRRRGYDEIYSFFGNDFSSTLLSSLLAQGIVMSNHYMSYGGTNHGSLGDSEVYSSYDYSAFIREFGMLSSRGRRMRMVSLFARTFSARGLACTDFVPGIGVAIPKVVEHVSIQADGVDSSSTSTPLSGKGGKSSRSLNGTSARVKTTVQAALLAVRKVVLATSGSAEGESLGSIAADSFFVPATSPHAVSKQLFAYLRNLSGGAGRFNLIVDDVVVPCNLPMCESMIVPLYYPLPRSASQANCWNPFTVFACTVPIIARAEHAGTETWVVCVREVEMGRLVLALPEDDETVVPPSAERKPRGVRLNWASLPKLAARSSEAPTWGTLVATEQDSGAATSLLSAPLEALPLSNWDAFGPGGESSEAVPPVALRVSTEAVGLSFSVAVKGGSGAFVASLVSSRDEDPEAAPALRLLCLPEEDAATFTADCRSDDPFVTSSVSEEPLFACAWGADELVITPDKQLSASFSSGKAKSVYLVRGDGNGNTPEEFTRASPQVLRVFPGVYHYGLPVESVPTALQAGVQPADALDVSFQIPMDRWERRAVSWIEDVKWTPISYAERDPLDHLMSTGFVAYRVRFRAQSLSASIITNIRHVAALYCNGVMVGSQMCYSHNISSAGAMHMVDVKRAGKQRHKLGRGLRAHPLAAEGVHELVILVLHFGQGRSPFLLNDVRNPRGLLSARFSRRSSVQNVEWAIAGVNVSKLENAYMSAGLPLESEVNNRSWTAGFEKTDRLQIVPNDGLVYYRSTFKVPSASVVGGDVRYPLRVKVHTGPRAVVVLWVNGMQIGRYAEAVGPQRDFYVPEGVITQHKDNLLVFGVFGPASGLLSVSLVPWVVDPVSGNIDEKNGSVFALRTVKLRLDGSGK